MSPDRFERLKLRIGRRRSGERGLTIIELLISLSLLILITGALAGGMQLLRRAFDVDRREQIAADADQAIGILADQVAAAYPLADARTGRLAFDGRPNAITFAKLEQGRANRAGLQRVEIQQAGDDLTIAVAPAARAPGAAAPTPQNAITLLSPVADIQFSYFGEAEPPNKPTWRRQWVADKRLPELVSIRVGFKDSERPPVTVMVALRQR